MNTPITVTTLIHAPLTKVWDMWTKPEHITRWAFASDDWEAPSALNDLRVGGRFNTVMAAKDKSAQFDFSGVYSLVEHGRIEYTMDDGRKVTITFIENIDGVQLTETFDPESENPVDMQRAGWQAILENFKKYVESAQ